MKILIRADASSEIGTGHVMRCMALAQAWIEQGGGVTFLMVPGITALETRLRAEGIQVVHMPFFSGSQEDVHQTIVHANSLNITWVVVDGYQFGADYQQVIKNAGLKLLLMDDYGHAKYYWADLVLNQNIYAHERIYANRDACTQLLLGTSYALLRKEFWPWRDWSRRVPAVACKILVTLGGSDPDNVTLNVIQALLQVKVDGLEVIVVVGSGNPHYEQLQKSIQGTEIAITLKHNVSNMPELMAWADLAVTAGGSTCWEIAFMGLPSLVIVLAENQCAIAEKLEAIGAVINLGWHTKLSPNMCQLEINRLAKNIDLRREISQHNRQLVDGEGSDRILMHLRHQRLRLRNVHEDDCELLWRWANDLSVRKAAFKSDFIPWQEHLQWFYLKLQDSSCCIYIALDRQDNAVGQIRFDIYNSQRAEIDISLDKSKRGLGYGAELIKLGINSFLAYASVQAVYASIKKNNHPSIRAFEKAGFQKDDTQKHFHEKAVIYVFEV